MFSTSAPKENAGQMPQSKKLKLDSALPVWDSGHGAIHASPDTHMISQLFPLAPHSAAAVNGNAGLNIVSDIMFGAHRTPSLGSMEVEGRDSGAAAVQSTTVVASPVGCVAGQVKSELATDRSAPGWTTYEGEMCHKVIGASMQEVSLTFAARFDKGFRYSAVDNANIGQKKNHFQVSYSLQSSEPMRYVLAETGLFQIDRFVLSLYGIKSEEPDHRVILEQSQSNRTRSTFHSVEFESKDCFAFGTVPRLHFSEPTGNNMRKQGQPHPLQKYFHLVATVSAQCLTGTDEMQSYPIAGLLSDRLVVRASNPRSFTTSPDVSLSGDHSGSGKDRLWRCEADGSISRSGRVTIARGVHPHALEVGGDLHLDGALRIRPFTAAGRSPASTSECLKRTLAVNVCQSAPSAQTPKTRGNSRTTPLDVADADGVTTALDVSQCLLNAVGATQELESHLRAALSRIDALETELATLRSKGSKDESSE